MSTIRRWIAPALVVVAVAVVAALLAYELGQNARWVGGRHSIMDPVTTAGSVALVVGVVIVAAVLGLFALRRRPGSLVGAVALGIGIGAAAGFLVGSNVGPVYPAGEEYPSGTISLDLATPDGRRLAGPVRCTVAFERDVPGGVVTSMRAMPLWGDAGRQLAVDVAFDQGSTGGADVTIHEMDLQGASIDTTLYQGRAPAGAIADDPDRRRGSASFTATAVEGGTGEASGSIAWDCRQGAVTPPATPTPVPTQAPPLGGSLTLTGDVTGTFTLTAPACDIADNSQLGAEEVTGSGMLADGRPAKVRLTIGLADAPRPLWGVNVRVLVDPDTDGVVLMPADEDPIWAELGGDFSFTLEAAGTLEGLGTVEVAGSWRCLETP